MSYTTRGTTPQEQQSAVAVTTTTYSLTKRYDGLRTDVETLAASLVIGSGGVSGWSIQPTEGPCASLVVEFRADSSGSVSTTTDPINTEWNLDTGSAMVPLTEHPSFVADWDTLSDAAQYQFRQLMDGDIDTGGLDASVAAEYAAAPFILTIYGKKLRGVTGYYRGEPTLQIVDRYQGLAPWGFDTAQMNVAYTASQLNTALGARSVNPIPSDVSTRITTLGGEWLCDHISVNTQSDGIRCVTQTFRWAPAWDSDLYDHAP